MSSPDILSISGLQLSNNTFSASPPGSLSKATNGVVSQKGVFEPRRGQAWASTMPAAVDLPFALTEFQGAILAQYGTSKTDTSQRLGYVNGGAITPYSGTYNPVGDDGAANDYMRTHFALASLFLHFCTQAGPKTLETYNGTPRTAGLSRQPDGLCLMADSTTVPFGSGFLPSNSSVAYRTVLRRPTSTNVPLLSPPSNRVIATNRILVPVGGLVRSGGTTVTATLLSSADYTNPPQLQIGDAFTLSPGETNFPAGSYTVASTPTTHSFTFASAGSNVASTTVEDIDVGSRGVEVEAQLSADAVAGDALRLYRSVATSESAINPSDDLYLVGERYLSAGDIIAGNYTFIDNTPQAVINDPLYTNPSDGDGQGLAGSNFQPPVYGDVANFDAQTWYLNTTGQQALRLEMLGVGAPNGVQDGDTLTIAGTTFTFKNAPVGPHEVQLTSDGDPAYNIASTTQALTVVAYGALKASGVGIYGNSSPTDLPGKVLIERTDWGAAFAVKASRPASWTPALSASTGTNSSPDAQPNGLFNSKLQQPEAVPPINFRNVGTANFYARRIFGLRNSLIVLKEGDGVWSLTGSGGNYNLQQISTANTIAPDCACVFSDSVWAYTDQGILRISDTGGSITISRPIETVLNALATALPAETYAWSFAVPYETERRVMFFIPVAAASSATGGAPEMAAYAYSSATNAWTGPLEFNENPVSGLVSTSHHLWLGAYDEVFTQGRITEERKTGTYLDIAEAQWSNTLATTADPLVVQLATAGAIQQGSGISQTISGTTFYTKVESVNGDGTYTVAETVPWANGACTIYDPYPIEVQFLPESEPATRKSLTRMVTLAKPGAFANLYGSATMETDQIQTTLEIPAPFPGFGSTPFGQGGFGNPTPMVVDTNPVAAQWAAAAQFYPGFKLDEVWCRLKLQGVAMMVEAASGPVGRGR